MGATMINFPVFTENADLIELLDDEQAGMLFKALMQYAKRGTVQEDMPLAVMLMFKVMAGQIDRMREKYEDLARRRSEAGRKAGLASASKRTAEQTTVNDRQRSSTDEYDFNDCQPTNTITNKREKDILTDIPKEKDPLLDEEPVASAWKEYADMRKKIKKPLTEGAISRGRAQLKSLSKGDPGLAVKILQQSVDHCWQGLFELKDPPNVIKKPNSFFDFSQRNDDLDAMIRREI